MTNTYTSLTGMFFTDSDGERYTTGEILAQVTEDTYLVRYDGKDVKSPQELVCVDEMLGSDETGFRLWHFFSDRAELKAWIDWLDAPPEPRLVTLVKQ